MIRRASAARAAADTPSARKIRTQPAPDGRGSEVAVTDAVVAGTVTVTVSPVRVRTYVSAGRATDWVTGAAAPGFCPEPQPPTTNPTAPSVAAATAVMTCRRIKAAPP